jgi:hypothetical protein
MYAGGKEIPLSFQKCLGNYQAAQTGGRQTNEMKPVHFEKC